MRDPARIRPFLEEIGDIWEDVPDWRFGQLVLNLVAMMDAPMMAGSTWNVEDDDWLRAANNLSDSLQEDISRGGVDIDD